MIEYTALVFFFAILVGVVVVILGGNPWGKP